MTTYQTPGVYVEEISVFPPSIAPVATAIPAFIGMTKSGHDLPPTRITSLKEFEENFGVPDSVTVTANVIVEDGVTTATLDSASMTDVFPKPLLYYAVRMFFDNGGGPCWICSIGAAADKDKFKSTITTLESYDEPTLIVFPDALHLGDDDAYYDVVNHSLKHCEKMQDRFTIFDVRGADSDDVGTNWFDAANGAVGRMRSKVSSTLSEKKYGAAYFPYLDTSLNPYELADTSVTLRNVAGAGEVDTLKLSDIEESHTAIYDAVKQELTQYKLRMPSSGAVAGAYAANDRSLGVWHAPANRSLTGVVSPTLDITLDNNDQLNIDATSGKSVNAIRSFTGKGTLIWGARTLAGNDNENRYVNVRRFLIFAEESIKKAMDSFVFESNDANTWVKVKSMIESFLTKQWRDGALAGAKPEDAFYVTIGLGKTMTFDDILNGYMNVEIGLAIVRPAEFIVLKFMQKVQTS